LPDVPVHVEYFSSPTAVIEEKMQLVNALKADGVLIFNNDDEKVRTLTESVRQQSIGYSRYSPSQFMVTNDDVYYVGTMPFGMSFNLTHIDQTVEMKLSGAIGVQHTYNFAAAAAVASVFDIPLAECSKVLSTYVPPPGRMRIIKGIKDTVIIDDTYNSSPVASERALSAMYELKGFKREIAVLGDMLELGKFSAREHERVGEQVADGTNILVTVGVRAHRIADGAIKAGMSEKKVLQYDDAIKAGRDLQNLIKPGDVILIKGSQSLRCEKIVEDIMLNPELAETLLVRQSKVWHSIT